MHHLYPQAPVRDALAAERTVLAAERTVLSYVRTAFALLLAGITASQLVESTGLRVVAWVVSGLGLGVFVLGLWRFWRSYRVTRRLIERSAQEGPP